MHRPVQGPNPVPDGAAALRAEIHDQEGRGRGQRRPRPSDPRAMRAPEGDLRRVLHLGNPDAPPGQRKTDNRGGARARRRRGALLELHGGLRDA